MVDTHLKDIPRDSFYELDHYKQNYDKNTTTIIRNIKLHQKALHAIGILCSQFSEYLQPLEEDTYVEVYPSYEYYFERCISHCNSLPYGIKLFIDHFKNKFILKKGTIVFKHRDKIYLPPGIYSLDNNNTISGIMSSLGSIYATYHSHPLSLIWTQATFKQFKECKTREYVLYVPHHNLYLSLKPEQYSLHKIDTNKYNLRTGGYIYQLDSSTHSILLSEKYREFNIYLIT